METPPFQVLHLLDLKPADFNSEEIDITLLLYRDRAYPHTQPLGTGHGSPITRFCATVAAPITGASSPRVATVNRRGSTAAGSAC